MVYKSYITQRKTYITWTERISKTHFKIKDVDIKNHYWHTQFKRSPGKYISCELKESQKSIPETKIYILKTAISTQMLREPHDSTFHVHLKGSREAFKNERVRYSEPLLA